MDICRDFLLLSKWWKQHCSVMLQTLPLFLNIMHCHDVHTNQADLCVMMLQPCLHHSALSPFCLSLNKRQLFLWEKWEEKCSQLSPVNITLHMKSMRELSCLHSFLGLHNVTFIYTLSQIVSWKCLWKPDKYKQRLHQFRSDFWVKYICRQKYWIGLWLPFLWGYLFNFQVCLRIWNSWLSSMKVLIWSNNYLLFLRSLLVRKMLPLVIQ